MAPLHLSSVSYHEHKDDERFWSLRGLKLGRINLLVGKNATGKTRTLNIITGLGQLLCGKRKEIFVTGNYDAQFLEHDVQHSYRLSIAHSHITNEQYDIAGETKLTRGGGGMGRLFAVELNQPMKFQAPDDIVAIVARRDELQHPYLNGLFNWGRSVRHLESGKHLGQPTVVLLIKGVNPDKDIDLDNIVAYFHMGLKAYQEPFKTAVLQDMNRIGYALTDIDIRKAEDVRSSIPLGGEFVNVAVKESDLACWTHQRSMSQGMYRALAQLIHLNYAILEKQDVCILIDDVGEGLDFERACALVEVLREKLPATSQLIMTTNNRFVMNNVPLEEWSVLQRSGSDVIVRNYENSRKEFDDFKFTGLSNFSLLET